MTLTLSEIARAIDGKVIGNRVNGPGPGHGPGDNSLWVSIAPHLHGGIWVKTFSSADENLSCKDYVLERLGQPAWAPQSGNRAPRQRVSIVPTEMDENEQRTAQALAIWSESHHPYGTPAEAYLTCPKAEGGRGVDLPHEAAGEAIRFHPNCPFAGKRTPALVCLVRDIKTDAPKAIHRTALSLDGQKVKVGGHDRLSLGPIGGGAIKLTPDADVMSCLGIGEGLESTLSLQLAPEFGHSPVWCVLSAGGMSRFPVLSGIECLWLAVDHDPAGLKAAALCSDLWRDAGREVFLVKPHAERSDLNDVVREDGLHA